MEFFITRKIIKWPYHHYQEGIIEVLLSTQKHFVQLLENEKWKELCVEKEWSLSIMHPISSQLNSLCLSL